MVNNRQQIGLEQSSRSAPTGSQAFVSSVTANPTRQPLTLNPFNRVTRASKSILSKFAVEDPIKRAYLRTSLLFGISVLVTWIPSSLNRIHSWIVGSSPYSYQVASAAVLPLQGVWNFIIFFVTSWRMVRDDVLYKTGRTPHRSINDSGMGTLDRTANREEHRMSMDFEADSLRTGSDVELHGVDPGSRKGLRL